MKTYSTPLVTASDVVRNTEGHKFIGKVNETLSTTSAGLGFGL